EPRLPQRLTGADIERAEHAIEIADEADAAGGRQHRRQERRALLLAPHLALGRRVVSDRPADVAVGSEHLEEASIGAGPAGAGLLLDLAARQLHARLARRNDQQAARLVITHRLPVVAAFRARA